MDTENDTAPDDRTRDAFLWTVRKGREMAHGSDDERRRFALYIAALRAEPTLAALADAIEEYSAIPPTRVH